MSERGISMNQEEYLALPIADRKRLAAKRSQERSAARRKGLPLPPTLAEEMGLPAKTGARRRVPKNVVKPHEPNDEVQRPTKPNFIARAGPVPDLWRTIVGFLHCKRKSQRADYLAEAKERGCKKQLCYTVSDGSEGIIYFKEMADTQFGRIQAILAGSNPGKRITYGDTERIGNVGASN